MVGCGSLLEYVLSISRRVEVIARLLLCPLGLFVGYLFYLMVYVQYVLFVA